MDGGGDSDHDLGVINSPTWAISLACFIFVLISLILERSIFAIGKFLKDHKKEDLGEALEKIKQELMLVGFISIALTVGEDYVSKICIPSKWVKTMHQCKPENMHEQIQSMDRGTCGEGKSNFISITGLHQLHIFLFVLVLVHVFITVLTMALARGKVHEWRTWEKNSMDNENLASAHGLPTCLAKETKGRPTSIWTRNPILAYVHAFFRMFYKSVSETDYQTLRQRFMETDIPTSHLAPFDFHKCIIKTLEDDFKHVVGVSPPLWGYIVLLMLVNINGWETYYWTSILQVFLVLIIGTQLEHIITKMPDVKLSNKLFWFKYPTFVIKFIHLIIFQNAITISTVIWSIVRYGVFFPKKGRYGIDILYLVYFHIFILYPLVVLTFHALFFQITFKNETYSCLFPKKVSIAVNLALAIISLIMCCYITLPIYALVSQMGSNLTMKRLPKNVQEATRNWYHRAINVRSIAPE